MLSQRSIRSQYILQLVVASAALIAIFSSILYGFIKKSLYEDLATQLMGQAKFIAASSPGREVGSRLDSFYINKTLGITIEVVSQPNLIFEIKISEYKKHGRNYLDLLYPYDFKAQTYLKLSKDITSVKTLLQKILNTIFIANLLGFALIIIYAFGVSKMLVTSITSLTERLARMNENFLTPIDEQKLPVEFMPLGRSINKLIGRIQTFVKYQKELFIGTAHELKTPLAVMKLKNEVTLIKRREPEQYIEALKINIKSINDMNKMITGILEIGRQESAQFEPPVEMDIIAFLREKAKDFELLAKDEQRNFVYSLTPQSLSCTIQPTLLTHILQNFFQNALKFTPQGRTVRMQSEPTNEGLKIEIIDEGPGIDEKVDLFAPFKRMGDKSGAGLGLFLAKGAADAMGATIALKNRMDAQGTVATIVIPMALACPIAKK